MASNRNRTKQRQWNNHKFIGVTKCTNTKKSNNSDDSKGVRVSNNGCWCDSLQRWVCLSLSKGCFFSLWACWHLYTIQEEGLTLCLLLVLKMVWWWWWRRGGWGGPQWQICSRKALINRSFGTLQISFEPLFVIDHRLFCHFLYCKLLSMIA